MRPVLENIDSFLIKYGDQIFLTIIIVAVKRDVAIYEIKIIDVHIKWILKIFLRKIICCVIKMKKISREFSKNFTSFSGYKKNKYGG